MLPGAEGGAMTIHRLPVPAATPLHRWGSREIGEFSRTAPRSGTLPEPGIHRHRLILEVPFMNIPSTAGADEWAGTAPCSHRRDAGLRPGDAAVRLGDLDPDRRRILRLLAGLDARRLPDGTILRMCVNRRRLRASAEAMQALHRLGLVNGAGSRDAWGTGNTPDSSWWWLSSAGLRLVTAGASAEGSMMCASPP
jgi:hypothetical protein